MRASFVDAQGRPAVQLVSALLAHVAPPLVLRRDVLVELRHNDESLAAQLALVRTDARVPEHVHAQLACVAETVAAVLAEELPNAARPVDRDMGDQVCAQQVKRLEAAAAAHADELAPVHLAVHRHRVDGRNVKLRCVNRPDVLAKAARPEEVLAAPGTDVAWHGFALHRRVFLLQRVVIKRVFVGVLALQVPVQRRHGAEESRAQVAAEQLVGARFLRQLLDDIVRRRLRIQSLAARASDGCGG